MEQPTQSPADPARRIHIRLDALMLEYNAQVADGRIPGPPLSRRGIAAATGMSPATVQRLAAGQSDRIALSTLERLCDLLRCDIGDLLQLRPVERSEPATA